MTVVALLTRLVAQLPATCQVFPHNRRLRPRKQTSFYPDLLVRCGRTADKQYGNDARFVFEVLSPSNGPQDRTRRPYAYQTLASVETIVFVDTESRIITVHERFEGHEWGERIVRQGALELGPDVVLDVDEMWADVDARVTS